MRTIALVFAVVITLLIVIVAFQNVTTSGQFLFLLGGGRASVTMMGPLLLMAVLGMIAGALYTYAIRAMLAQVSLLEEQEAEREHDAF